MRNATTTTNVGNVDLAQGEQTSIHPAAYGVLMDILSGVYSNQMKAVLREYSVNGWDEHQKHGVERPVEVTLPSLLQPTLVIRDFGPGIPLNGVYQMNDDGSFALDEQGNKICLQMGAMEVFGEYGNSSKRKSDTEAGCFGIGSKSAFALGHQFVVTGFKDGQTFTVLFTLNDDGTGTKTVMAEGPTTEPNGVEVSMGVDDVDQMRATAEEFFRFWNRGDVLVDGEEPTPVFESLEQISDEIFIDSNGRGEAFAVMGPVSYPVDRDLLRKVSAYLAKNDLGEMSDLPLRLIDSNTDLYIKVPMGGVIPAPSREALRDKNTTIQTLGAVFLGLHQDSVVKVQKTMDEAPSFFAAAKALHDMNETLGAFKVARKAVSWNGQKVKGTVPVEMMNFHLALRSYRATNKSLMSESTYTAEFPAVDKVLVVTGLSEGEFGLEDGPVRRFAKRFLEQNEDGIERVFATSADSASFGWFQFGVQQGVRTMTLEEWRAALKKMRKCSPRMINEPSYTTGFGHASRDLDDRDLLSEILEWGQDIVVFHDRADCNTFEREVLKDYTVLVLLGTQSLPALTKRVEAAAADEENPSTVKIVDWEPLRQQAADAAQAEYDSMTDAEKEALGAREWLRQNRSEVRAVAHVIEALSLKGEVTNRAMLSASESVELAEIVAEGITTDRYNHLEGAFKAVKRYAYADLSSSEDVVEYDDKIVEFNADLPLLNTRDVINGASKIRKYSVLEEDGTRTYTNGDRWSYYDEDDFNRDNLLLEHSLAYVNSL